VSQALIDFLLTRGRAIILEDYESTSCIASTRIAMEVLRSRDIEVRPQAVAVEALNRQAVLDAERAADAPGLGAWIVACEATGNLDRAENSWDGHLVAIFEDAKGEVLLDLSADQFARPAKGIHAEPLAIRIKGWPLGWRWPNGSAIAYRPAKTRSYRQSTNWRDGRWRPTLDRIMAEAP